MSGSRLSRAALLLCALIAVALAAPTHASAQRLCNGHADLCSRPFSETVLVGTHNSMAADDYGWSFTLTTQTHTIRRQLDRGVRALSLDIHYAEPGFLGGVYNEDGPTRGNVAPYLCHNVCLLGSLRLTIGLNSIAGFLRDNPNEVIAIYVEDYISPEDLARDLQASELWPYIHEGPLTRTLGEMIALDKRVVMISQNRTSSYAWYPKLTQIGRDTTYEFPRTNLLTDPARLWDSCRPTPWGAAGRGRILVMQHFVTPTTTGSRSASTIVNQRDVVAARALKCRERHGVMPSIILVDYYELGDIFGAVRALNDLYVGPAPGCEVGDECGRSPGSSEAGATPEPSCADCHSEGVATTVGADLRALRLAPIASRRVRAGATIRLRVSIANRGDTQVTVPVRVRASRASGLRYPPLVQVAVPAGQTATRTIALRVATGARAGRVTIVASTGGLQSRVTLAIRGNAATPSPVTG